jgi:hypothetical protein
MKLSIDIVWLAPRWSYPPLEAALFRLWRALRERTPVGRTRPLMLREDDFVRLVETAVQMESSG